MGLKIRRLKNGFAYYAEYKFGGHTIYESIKASSRREARRRYAARYEQLRNEIKPGAKPLTLREARDHQISAVLSGLVQTLVAKRVLSRPEASELLHHAFAQLDLSHGSAAAIRSCGTLREELLSEFSGPHFETAAPDMTGPAGDANADRVRLIPSEI